LGHAGDQVIIVSYAGYEEEEVACHVPTVVHVDGHNRLLPDLRSGTAV
jgi:aspartate 1-decarboxylase